MIIQKNKIASRLIFYILRSNSNHPWRCSVLLLIALILVSAIAQANTPVDGNASMPAISNGIESMTSPDAGEFKVGDSGSFGEIGRLLATDEIFTNEEIAYLAEYFAWMAEHRTSARRAHASEGALVLTGTIAHGEVVTVTTDGTHDFGTRSNAKPLYVYAGDSNGSGSHLGRTTTNLFAAAATYETGYAVGGFEGAMVFDHKGSSAAIWGGLLLDPTRPTFVSGLRLRDFDMTQVQYQNASGGLNLKTHRIWAGLGPSGPNNFYIGYQGSEGGNCRAAVENVPGTPSRYYDANPEPFLWQDEVVAFRNSSAPGVLDGQFRHFLDNVALNSETTLVTHSETNFELLKVLYLDQISNGSGHGVSAVNNAIASLIVDDEPKQIWIGNASTVAASTRMYPIPTVAWSTTELKAFVLEGSIPADSMYLYVMTGWDLTSGVKTWVSETGIRNDDLLFANDFEQVIENSRGCSESENCRKTL